MNRQKALAILGLSGDPDEKAIKKAYKSKANKTHPDKDGGSEEAFKEVQEAKAYLDKPEDYGDNIHWHHQNGQRGNAHDVWEEMMSAQARAMRQKW